LAGVWGCSVVGVVLTQEKTARFRTFAKIVQVKEIAENMGIQIFEKFDYEPAVSPRFFT
jgi:hypothetical protein